MELTDTQKLTIIFDEYLISKGKHYISLRTANELLRGQDNEEFRNLDLKGLLESNKLSHAYRTENKPRQWQIPYSNPDEFQKKRKEYLKANKVDNPIELNQTSTKKPSVWTFVVIGIVLLILYSVLNNDDTKSNSTNSEYSETTNEFYQKTPTEKENTVDLNELTGKKFTFKSTLNDKEFNGVIVQTNHETSYHTFDFINKIVTQKSALNGQWVTITYPMRTFYQEKGILATTYVIEVNELGVSEIWFSPDVPNLGYDYSDGSRIACYEISRVK